MEMWKRRDFLMLSPLLLSRRAEGAKPWLDRKPAEWTPRDIQTVLNDSAWVRTAALTTERTAERKLPIPYEALVRWESGLPVRLARRKAATENRAGEYQLSISRLPLVFVADLSGKAPADVAAGIARSARLERSGKEPIRAAHAEWVEWDFSPGVLVSFARGQQPIETEDGEVTLAAQVGLLVIRARFPLKQMVYRGKLEL
jgi:hypothetical protein